MCVDATPKACTIANDQMTGGFIGMIFGFFIALFGASLVVPSVLMKLIKRIKGRGHMNVIILLLPLFLLVIVTPAIAHDEKPDQIAPNTDKSWKYNSGFSAGYLSLPLKRHHTQEYLTGYRNGTASYEFNRG